MSDPIESVLDERYKPSFRILLAVIAVGVGLGFAVSQAQDFVDARINAKILAGNAVIESQGSRIERLDSRLDEVRSAVMEIKADVRVLRETAKSK